jgi:hypothetical protein
MIAYPYRLGKDVPSLSKPWFTCVCAHRTITLTLKFSTAYALKRCEGKNPSRNPNTRLSPSIPIIYCSVTAVMRGMHVTFSYSLG